MIKFIDVFRSKPVDQPINAFQEFLEHHLIDASFLWVLRSIGLNQPHYTQEDITEIEQRIDEHLNGLMNYPDLAWELCLDALQYEQAGEAFVAAIVAFRSHDIDKIKIAVSAGLINDDTTKGLISALGWLPANLVRPWLQKFLTSKELEHKYLAIATCSVRRENPGDILTQILQREDCIAHTKLYIRTLRLIGELKLHHLRWALDEKHSEIPEVCFWLNWSKLMLGDFSIIEQLQQYTAQPSSYQQIAIQTAFRALPIDVGRAWISQLASDPEQIRTVIKATAALGDPHAVPWLIEKMRHIETARLAGEAFTTITGIDLVRYGLSIDVPDEITVLPDDGSDDDYVDLDEDENLPLPEVDKVAYTWQKHGAKYQPGQRYFMGNTLNSNILHKIIKDGFQRQRYSASLSLALLENQSPFMNIKTKSLIEADG